MNLGFCYSLATLFRSPHRYHGILSGLGGGQPLLSHSLRSNPYPVIPLPEPGQCASGPRTLLTSSRPFGLRLLGFGATGAMALLPGRTWSAGRSEWTGSWAPGQEERKKGVHWQHPKCCFQSRSSSAVQAGGFLCGSVLGCSLDFWERRMGHFVVNPIIPVLHSYVPSSSPESPPPGRWQHISETLSWLKVHRRRSSGHSQGAPWLRVRVSLTRDTSNV